MTCDCEEQLTGDYVIDTETGEGLFVISKNNIGKMVVVCDKQGTEFWHSKETLRHE
jgi:hypothetical protein